MGARVRELASEAWRDEGPRRSAGAGTVLGVELAYTLAGLEKVFRDLRIPKRICGRTWHLAHLWRCVHS
jgi:hypothetical protein